MTVPIMTSPSNSPTSHNYVTTHNGTYALAAYPKILHSSILSCLKSGRPVSFEPLSSLDLLEYIGAEGNRSIEDLVKQVGHAIENEIFLENHAIVIKNFHKSPSWPKSRSKEGQESQKPKRESTFSSDSNLFSNTGLQKIEEMQCPKIAAGIDFSKNYCSISLGGSCGRVKHFEEVDFSLDFLKENYSEVKIRPRDVSIREDWPEISLGLYIDHLQGKKRLVSTSSGSSKRSHKGKTSTEDNSCNNPSLTSTHSTYGIYGKDLSCPSEWANFLRLLIPDEWLIKGGSDLMRFMPTNDQPECLMIYIGDAGTRTPGHLDLCASIGHNLMIHVEGSEDFDYAPIENLVAPSPRNAINSEGFSLEEAKKVCQKNTPIVSPGYALWFIIDPRDRQLASDYWAAYCPKASRLLPSNTNEYVSLDELNFLSESNYFSHSMNALALDATFLPIEYLVNAPFKVLVHAQSLGDFVILPGNAPHQVLNLGSTATSKIAWNRITPTTLINFLTDGRVERECIEKKIKCLERDFEKVKSLERNGKREYLEKDGYREDRYRDTSKEYYYREDYKRNLESRYRDSKELKEYNDFRHSFHSMDIDTTDQQLQFYRRLLNTFDFTLGHVTGYHTLGKQEVYRMKTIAFYALSEYCRPDFFVLKCCCSGLRYESNLIKSDSNKVITAAVASYKSDLRMLTELASFLAFEEMIPGYEFPTNDTFYDPFRIFSNSPTEGFHNIKYADVVPSNTECVLRAGYDDRQISLEGRYLKTHSYSCDFCKCDIFNRFFHCSRPHEDILDSNGDSGHFLDLCVRCVALGRTCRHIESLEMRVVDSTMLINLQIAILKANHLLLKLGNLASNSALSSNSSLACHLSGKFLDLPAAAVTLQDVARFRRENYSEWQTKLHRFPITAFAFTIFVSRSFLRERQNNCKNMQKINSFLTQAKLIAEKSVSSMDEGLRIFLNNTIGTFRDQYFPECIQCCCPKSEKRMGSQIPYPPKLMIKANGNWLCEECLFNNFQVDFYRLIQSRKLENNSLFLGTHPTTICQYIGRNTDHIILDPFSFCTIPDPTNRGHSWLGISAFDKYLLQVQVIYEHLLKTELFRNNPFYFPTTLSTTSLEDHEIFLASVINTVTFKRESFFTIPKFFQACPQIATYRYLNDAQLLDYITVQKLYLERVGKEEGAHENARTEDTRYLEGQNGEATVNNKRRKNKIQEMISPSKYSSPTYSTLELKEHKNQRSKNEPKITSSLKRTKSLSRPTIYHSRKTRNAATAETTFTESTQGNPLKLMPILSPR